MQTNNPWLSIWTEPRATIAKIVEENPNRSLWVLAWIYGFGALLGLSQSMVLGTHLSALAILIIAAVIAPIYGYINFSVWSFIVAWTGKWLKGEGHFKSVRSAYAWSCVPLTVNVPLWLLMVVIFGHQLFLNLPDAYMMSGGKVFVLFLIMIIKVVLAIWSLVIYINALSQVQKFSVLRAIFNVVIAAVIIGIILYVLWAVLFYLVNI